MSYIFQSFSMNLLVLILFIWTLKVESSVLPLHRPNSGVISAENLQQSLGSIASLPLWSQKVMLKAIGEEHVRQNKTHCNVFGGLETCSTVSHYLDYMKSCNSKNKLVDCAFEVMLSQNNFYAPPSLLHQYVRAEEHIYCANCIENLEKFWCALTAPPCGTIDKVLDEIPHLISSTSSTKSSVAIALQQAVPRIIQAASLGFPCKKMCNAVMGSCGCGQSPTFGKVMDAIQVGGELNTMTAVGLSIKELFQLIWDKHVCDLFSEDSIPGFSGICIYSDETSKCDWCNGVKGRQSIHKQVVEHGVAQMSQMISTLLQGGLEEILSASDRGTLLNFPINQATSPSTTRKRRGHAGAVVLVVFSLAFIIFSVVATIRLSHNRPVPSQYVDLSSMGYTPPML
eukprot:Gb_13640 [translate_table: standard]